MTPWWTRPPAAVASRPPRPAVRPAAAVLAKPRPAAAVLAKLRPAATVVARRLRPAAVAVTSRSLQPAAPVTSSGWVVAVAVALALAPWLVDGYTLFTAARIMAVGLLAVSVAVLTGTAGLPTLGQTAPYAVGAYTAGLLARAGYPVAPAQLLVAMVAAAAFSVLVGAAVVRTRGVVFLMVTLAVGQLTATAAGQLTSVTGGTDGLTGIPTSLAWPGGPALIEDRHLYWFALAVLAGAVAVVVAVLRSPAGMLVRGCRDNEARMHASGHPVGRYLLATYTGAGALAGLGGALLVISQRYVSPADVGFQVSALVLLAVIVGGAHSVVGAVVASALVLAVRDWAAGAIPGHGPLLLGLLFIAAVYLLPRGAAGALADLTRRVHPPRPSGGSS